MKKIVAAITALALAVTVALPANAAKFTDVSDGYSLGIEIEYLADKGIIKGYDDGTFRPSNPIAKKHIASMLVKALNLPKDNLKNPNYADVPTTHLYYEDIAAAYTAGLFGDATNFKPDSSISRAFMAKILATAFNLKSIADNAVTYKDVPTSSEFYTPIQLVTMNNVAKGYTADGTFRPNQLITRAHFSAFLARAMSLIGGDFTPEVGYKYFYEDAGKYRYRMELDGQDTSGMTTYKYWDLYDDATNEKMDYLMYATSPSRYYEGVPQSEVGTNIEFPFTIGRKGEAPGYLSRNVLNTKVTMELAGKTYTDVVIVEETLPSGGGGIEKITTYYAKGHGIVAYKNTDGYFTYWLTDRTPVQQ